jgi:hypothetical protein
MPRKVNNQLTQAQERYEQTRNQKRQEKLAKHTQKGLTQALPAPERPAPFHAVETPVDTAPQVASSNVGAANNNVNAGQNPSKKFGQPKTTAFINAVRPTFLNLVHVFNRSVNWEIHSCHGLIHSLVKAITTHINTIKTNDPQTRNIILHDEMFSMFKCAILAAIAIMIKSPACVEHVQYPPSYELSFVISDPACPSILTNWLNAFSPLQDTLVVNAYDQVVKLALFYQDLLEIERTSRENNYQGFTVLKTAQGWAPHLARFMYDGDVMYAHPNSQLHTTDFFHKHVGAFKVKVFRPEDLPELDIRPVFSRYPGYNPSIRVRKFAFYRIDEWRIKSESPDPLLGGELEFVNAIIKYKYYDNVIIDRPSHYAIADFSFTSEIINSHKLVRSIDAEQKVMTRDNRCQNPIVQAVPLPIGGAASIEPEGDMVSELSEIENEEPHSNEARLEALVSTLSAQYPVERRDHNGKVQFQIPTRNDRQQKWVSKRSYFAYVARQVLMNIGREEEEQDQE